MQHRITEFFGLFSSSNVLGNRNTTFRKLHLFPSSGEEGRTEPLIEISSFLGAQLSMYLLPPSPEDGNRCSFRNVVFLLPRILDDGKSPKKNRVILSAIHHRRSWDSVVGIATS
jgi:hypothetical protein